jgi:hypothetical protein
MDHKAKVIQRLRNPEDGYVERKPESAKGFEIRKTIVGFANSVPEGIDGILFLGVSNDGKILGLSNPDSLQKTIRNICKVECYPPIKYQSEIVQDDGKNVLAVIVPESRNKPHFSGPSFVRVGSATDIASEEMFNELILNRIDKCRNILRHKGSICTVEAIGRRLLSRRAVGSGYVESAECRIDECTAHYVTFNYIDTGTIFSIELNDISISKDHNKNRLKLIAR